MYRCQTLLVVVVFFFLLLITLVPYIILQNFKLDYSKQFTFIPSILSFASFYTQWNKQSLLYLLKSLRLKCNRNYFHFKNVTYYRELQNEGSTYVYNSCFLFAFRYVFLFSWLDYLEEEKNEIVYRLHLNEK